MLPDDQAVTEDDQNTDSPDEGNEADDRATDARDDDLSLDELLERSQAEDESEPGQDEPDDKSKDVEARLAALEKDNAELRRENAQEKADAAINSAAADIKGLSEDLQNVPERAIKGYLYAFAEEKPGVLKIFANRDTRPQAWNDLKRVLAKEIAADLGGSGSDELAAGIQAAQDAVRGVSNKPVTDESEKVSNEKLTDMDNAEFEQHKVKLRKAEAAGAAR